MSNQDNKTTQNGAPRVKQKFGRMFLRFRQDTNILFELTRKGVKTQYRGSVLGMLWTVLNPLLNMAVMWVVFSSFFGSGDETYAIYLLTGNILFASLSASTNGALGSLVGNRGLLLRTKINPHLFPISAVTTALVSLGFSFVALIVIMLGVQLGSPNNLELFGVQMLLILAMLPAFLLFESGVGLFLSAVYVYGRDIRHFYSVFLTLWMYLTPIFWQSNILIRNTEGVIEKTIAMKVVECNPMYYFLQYFREAVYYTHCKGQSIWILTIKETGEKVWLAPAILRNVPMLLWLYILGVVTCVVGAGLFCIMKKRFATHL